jgi:magnesium transporter
LKTGSSNQQIVHCLCYEKEFVFIDFADGHGACSFLLGSVTLKKYSKTLFSAYIYAILTSKAMKNQGETSRTTQGNRTRKNNLLYESLGYNGTFMQSTEVRITSYDGDACHTEVVKDPAKIKLPAGKVNWVHVSGLSNLTLVTSVCRHFGLVLPVVQDILNVRHISKLEETGGLLFAVLDAYTSDSPELVREHQSLVLGKDFVLSFEEGTGHRFDPVCKALDESVGQIRQHGADYLFNLLISVVVDSYFDVLEGQQTALLEMEDTLMEFQASHQETGRQIQVFRRDFTRLKKAVSPLRESFGRMLMLESTLIKADSKLYFRDTYDHLQQVMSMLEANRETIASLVDLYLANNDLRANNIMKQLTVVATIFIPLTFLVGVWGMNFKYMPELGMVNGYLYSWLIIIALGVILYFWFRRKNML